MAYPSLYYENDLRKLVDWAKNVSWKVVSKACFKH